MLDYSGNNQDTGKNLGDDLAEGKPTLPLIYAMRVGTPAQASIIRKAIEDGGKDGFQPVMDVIRQTAALDYAKQCAEAEIATATAAIASLPESEYKTCLLQLASFAVTRNH
jgi:octaprenyl-diphosphate synthase